MAINTTYMASDTTTILTYVVGWRPTHRNRCIMVCDPASTSPCNRLHPVELAQVRPTFFRLIDYTANSSDRRSSATPCKTLGKSINWKDDVWWEDGVVMCS